MIYIIKHGDTLSEIAQRFGTTTAELARINSIDDPDKIYAGHMIVVPPGATPVAEWWKAFMEMLSKPLW